MSEKETKNRYLYYINGAGCQLTDEKGKPILDDKGKSIIGQHFYHKEFSKNFNTTNTFICCFPERALQTIGTRLFNVGNPIEDIIELQIETLQGSIPLIVQIMQQICSEKKVFLFGHSFGGLIVNRICEEIAKCLKEEGYFEKKYGTYSGITLDKIFDNFMFCLIAASFGSIYIPKKENLGLINLINYMYINDVAIRCNFQELIGWDGYIQELFGSDKIIPNHSDLERNFICYNEKIVFKYNSQSLRNRVVFLNVYHYNSGTGESLPISDESITCDINLGSFSKQWRLHNLYSVLIKFLLNVPTNNIHSLEQCTKKVIDKDEPISIRGKLVLTLGGKSKRNKRIKFIMKTKRMKRYRSKTKKRKIRL